MNDPMPPWPVGIQLRPWLQSWGRDGLAARLTEVMATVARLGYDGFETQLGVLPLDDPEAFREASARVGGIVPCGAHTGGRWGDEGAPDIPALIGHVARLPALGCRTLVVSMGLAADAPDRDVERAVERLGQLGRRCREAGVTVAFHNHGRELEDDARLLRAIVAGCPPEDLALGADLGWVAHVGWDVGDFLTAFGDRVAYLHVRDVVRDGPAAGFTEVGRGKLDFATIAAALAGIGYDGWLVAESELGERWHGATDPEESARLQIAGLQALVRMRDGGEMTT